MRELISSGRQKVGTQERRWGGEDALISVPNNKLNFSFQSLDKRPSDSASDTVYLPDINTCDKIPRPFPSVVTFAYWERLNLEGSEGPGILLVGLNYPSSVL